MLFRAGFAFALVAVLRVVAGRRADLALAAAVVRADLGPLAAPTDLTCGLALTTCSRAAARAGFSASRCSAFASTVSG